MHARAAKPEVMRRIPPTQREIARETGERPGCQIMREAQSAIGTERTAGGGDPLDDDAGGLGHADVGQDRAHRGVDLWQIVIVERPVASAGSAAERGPAGTRFPTTAIFFRAAGLFRCHR